MKHVDLMKMGILVICVLSFTACKQEMQKGEKSISEIRSFVMNEPLFDSHDHQGGYNQEWDQKNYEEFIGYARADMETAIGGLKKGDVNHNFDVWQYVRTTGYGQAANFATNKLFGLDYTRENAEEITDAVQDFVSDKTPEEIYRELCKIANITGVINDVGGGRMPDPDYFTQNLHPDFFKKVLRYGRFETLTITESSQIEKFEERFNESFQKLSDLDTFLDEYTKTAYETGNLAGLKIAIAYARDIDFKDVSYEEASEIYSKILQGKKVNARPLSDYMIHKIFQRAEILDIPVQIHTGYLAGNWQDVRWTDPSQLIPVFQKYRKVRFNVFHAGWPYSEILGSIGKQFPNVWLDMCWAWTINPVQMERILDEWLSCVPSNKIFTFGGDTWSPFPMVGYAEQVRNGIANVLEKKINSGEYDLETAKFVAERIMHKNAEEFFGFN